MKIQLTLAQAQSILCEKVFGPALLDGAKLDGCVTVEITMPQTTMPVPVNGNGYWNKIRAIRALRDDYTAQNLHLGLCEAKRLVELVYDGGNAKI